MKNYQTFILDFFIFNCKELSDQDFTLFIFLSKFLYLKITLFVIIFLNMFIIYLIYKDILYIINL